MWEIVVALNVVVPYIRNSRDRGNLIYDRSVIPAQAGIEAS
jgi:hypothetical protein